MHGLSPAGRYRPVSRRNFRWYADFERSRK